MMLLTAMTSSFEHSFLRFPTTVTTTITTCILLSLAPICIALSVCCFTSLYTLTVGTADSHKKVNARNNQT